MAERKKFLTVQDMALIGIFTALIVVCSWISLNVGALVFTLQTFAVFTVSALLGTKKGVIAILVYILLGLAGVPVFAGFKGGPTVLAGPTGGYIIGFIFTALIIGKMTEIFQKRNAEGIMITAVSMILGDMVCFLVGTFWFMAMMKTDFLSAVTLCVVPYIIPDLVKVLVATMIVNRIKKHVRIFH